MTVATLTSTAVQTWADTIRTHVAQVVVGQDTAVDLLLVALLCEGHVLLEDVPGIGKTTLIHALARSIDSSFRRIQSTPDLLPTDITGLTFFNQQRSEFIFRPGPIFANIVLADELNRATPRTQSALLEAMQERTVTIDGQTHTLARPFLVLATQNPVELAGTYPLPEAQLDRFLLRLRLGYPSAANEAAIVDRFTTSNPLSTLKPVCSAADVQAMIAEAAQTHLSPAIRDYLIALVRATREHESVELGASPRASLALAQSARALAAIRGETYVLPDHVQALAPAVLEHRLILHPEARLLGHTSTTIVSDVLKSVPVPVEES